MTEGIQEDMKTELISVIIPVYKVEKYINRCVESVLVQNYHNIEVILVDDGSPDNCGIICDKYAEKDSRIKVIHKKNGGLSDARNAGLDIATGHYICFIDSDDYIEKDMLKDMYDNIVRTGADITICNYCAVDNEGHKQWESENISDGEWTEKEFWKNFYDAFEGMYYYYVVAWNKLYSRKIFEKTRYCVGKKYEDNWILYDVISQCDKISVLNKAYYYYIQRQDSIMAMSYSKKDLSIPEANIIRAENFITREEWKFAEASLHCAVKLMLGAYARLDFSESGNKEEYIRVRNRLHTEMNKIIKHISIKHMISWNLFLMNPGLHKFLGDIKWKIKNIK